MKSFNLMPSFHSVQMKIDLGHQGERERAVSYFCIDFFLGIKLANKKNFSNGRFFGPYTFIQIKKILIDFVHNTITLRYIFDTLRKTFIRMPFKKKKEREMGIPILRGDLCREKKMTS